MEMQAEMFDRMCSIRSSEMSIDDMECKDTNDDQSGDLEIFTNQLWKDPGSSKRDYGVNIFSNISDKEMRESVDNNL